MSPSSCDAAFHELVHAAWERDFSGWDFAHISQRMLQEPLSWDYRQLVLEKLRAAGSLLDLDTGGGEFLASLQPLPARAWATEAFLPNIDLARSRLEPLGVRVFPVAASGPLPFEDGSFDLVINRHGVFSAPELGRILGTGKRFLTQQVGGRNNLGLNEILQKRIDFQHVEWELAVAERQLEAHGFRIVDRREEHPAVRFLDVGAVVYYLKAIPWQVQGFTIAEYLGGLEAIHEVIAKEGEFRVTGHRFYLEAQRR